MLTVCITLFILVAFFYFKTKEDAIKNDKADEYFKQHHFIHNLLKYGLFSRMDRFLKEGGYPLSLNLQKYILFMLMILSTVIYIMFDVSIKSGGLIGLLVAIPLHLMIYKSYKEHITRIQMDLCDIQDILYFQSKIGTPMDIILVNAARMAKGPLKKPFEETASCYKITRDINKALDKLLEASSLMEIHALAFILKQKVETGFSEENHKAQAVMIKRNKRLKKRIEREIRRNKLIVAAVLLFACYVFMVTVPIFKETFISVKKILN